jgi:hypothetical protein
LQDVVFPEDAEILRPFPYKIGSYTRQPNEVLMMSTWTQKFKYLYLRRFHPLLYENIFGSDSFQQFSSRIVDEAKVYTGPEDNRYWRTGLCKYLLKKRHAKWLSIQKQRRIDLKQQTAYQWAQDVGSAAAMSEPKTVRSTWIMRLNRLNDNWYRYSWDNEGRAEMAQSRPKIRRSAFPASSVQPKNLKRTIYRNHNY